MRVEFRSHLLESASYDPDKKMLCIHLVNGERREFEDVPKDIFDALFVAKSAGQYYFDNIRHRFKLKD